MDEEEGEKGRGAVGIEDERSGMEAREIADSFVTMERLGGRGGGESPITFARAMEEFGRTTAEVEAVTTLARGVASGEGSERE